MIKRLFDIVFSLGGMIILSPFFIVIWLVIRLDSAGGAIFRQIRVGRHNKDFTLYKFRTMSHFAEQHGQLTIGNDNRITGPGRILRKFKLDELPQLLNVLKGDMSFVGPRPEVRKYVNLYSTEQMKVLNVKPGITDYASLKYFDENTILGQSADPEYEYIHRILPEKLALNLIYAQKSSIVDDLKIICATLFRIFSR